jgi:hypothetical protein
MFILRLNAGSASHRFKPPRLLAGGSVLAAVGLFGLSEAGDSTVAIFLMATLYGVGKAIFLAERLGVVSGQFPKGGALTPNETASG